ncbi:hypothetical protein OEZ85_002974 [Tetradesmus obliquus]|uniref:Uncharacterized protein n=1 Tax=Tetradesmus obliquus TaxID=3088 RepID=A0ABY8U019_TETOB|nr:hypothetical protein OEZ85_002974 [Tetradesmus obliquus]
MTLPTSFYLKLAGACFLVGAGMEFFMINTGFYRIVTQAEAQNWEETRDLREQRAAALRQQLLEQYRKRGQAPPEALLKEP